MYNNKKIENSDQRVDTVPTLCYKLAYAQFRHQQHTEPLQVSRASLLNMF